MDYSAIIGFAAGLLSGLAPSIFQSIMSRPKLRGAVVGISCGMFGNLNEGRNLQAIFTVDLYIANDRNIPVPIFDYQMEVDYGDGYILLGAVYGPSLGVDLSNTDGSQTHISLEDDDLFNKTSHLVGQNNPLRGFAFFVGELSHHERFRSLKKIKVTCFDGYGKKHRIITKAKDISPTGFVRRLASVKKIAEVIEEKKPTNQTREPKQRRRH